MKRILSVLLCAAVLSGLAGCGETGEPSPSVPTEPSTESTAPSVSAESSAESAAPPVSAASSEETAQSSSSDSETPWRYTAEQPKEFDLAAMLANFPRRLSMEELSDFLSDPSPIQEPEGKTLKYITSADWCFMDTEGVLRATYMDDPESDGILLERLDYWTLNYDLETYAKMLDGINALQLPGVENYEQRPLALSYICLHEQGDRLPVEEYTEPYLPANSNTYDETIFADGAGEKVYAINCIFWSGDQAEEFCPEILKEDASEILSGIMIRISYSTDVGP